MEWTDDRLQHQFEAIEQSLDRLETAIHLLGTEMQGLHLAITRGSIAVSVGLVGLIAAILAGG